MADETTIIEEYSQITYQDAQRRLTERFSATNTTLPPITEITARRAFDKGDHWQDGEGFIGALPTGEGADDRTELLRKAFSPEDVISEVLDTHIENVLGESPIIGLEDVDENEIAGEDAELLEIVKEWFEKRENEKVLADALRGARRESARVLRAFIPSGIIDGEGRISAQDLRDALSKIWIRSENIENGGVIVDESTATELGLMLYKMRINKADVSLCEYAYLNENNETVWGTASAHTAGDGSEIAEPLQLNGQLPIYQLNAKALITDSVCQAQRDVNLSGTMLTRNNNLAGSRERLAVGVQPPGDWAEATDESGVVTKTFTARDMQTGPGKFNFLSAMPVFDKEGGITGFGNPNVIFTDPVPIDTFLGTSNHWRTVIYSKAKMRHLLMADNATASGKSRIEARKEFQSSLNDSKQIADAAGKWMIELAVNIAAHFIGQPGKYLDKRFTFDSQVSTIELTSEEIQQIRDDYEAGMIDLKTALEMRGHKNVEEILERIKEEEERSAKVKPVLMAQRMPGLSKELGVGNETTEAIPQG